MLEAWIQSFKAFHLWLSGEAFGKVEALTSDSREVISSSNTVFFARKGVTQDGHDYLVRLADAKNIVAFVVERIPEGFCPKAPVIVVRDSTAAMALAAKFFYRDPTADSFCVAVTGTNGKTTSTYLLQSLLEEKGLPCARMGTIETQFRENRWPSHLTTPDFSKMQALFSDLKEQGARAFVFEASSHALDQRRLLGLDLDAALFTNLSPEHLDYHQTMQNYYEAKQKLFFDLLAKQSQKKRRLAVVPFHGAYGAKLIRALVYRAELELWSWGFEEHKEMKNFLKINQWKTSLEGSEWEISGLGLKPCFVHSKLIGKHNIENLMGVLVLGLALGMSFDAIQKAIARVRGVPGRLDKIVCPQGGTVFVDYAHTPDALENVLSTLRPLIGGKLRVVFGCGGDRDRSKRAKMGEVAELYADEVFITSDNPRTESPEAIVQDILKGVRRLKPVMIEMDRKTAIERSLERLTPDDVVLIAGKGHENYQILGTTKIHFDDKEVVCKALAIG